MLAQTEADSVSSIETRIGRLTAASLRRVIEPDLEVTGSVAPGMVVAKELLTVADLDLDLTDDQWAALSREELASVLDAGVRFESILMAGFGLMLAWKKDLVDPRVTYVLHEIGEETRHSRLFVKVIEQLAPKAVNPFTRGLYCRVDRFITSRAITRQALFCVLVLTGEEVPDLIQKRSSEHPDTDPFVRAVNRYHRLEEARHLAFARTLLPEVWGQASALERFVIRHFGPAIMAGVVDSLIHPGVYRAVGLPGWRTWNKVRKAQSRRDLKMEAFGPIFEALRAAGAFGDHSRSRIPRAWRQIGERVFQDHPSRA
jgi:hypothetical protein